MAKEARNESDETHGGIPVPFHLRLGTPKSCRQTMSRIIREHARGNVDPATARSIVWSLGQLLAYWRFEKDLEIEERLSRLESASGIDQ